MSEPTEFWATVSKVQTMADGGLRVYFDLPESATLQAAELMEYKRQGIVAQVTVKPKIDDAKPDDDGKARDNTEPIY